MNKFKLGIAFYLTVRGIPQIYSGTEIFSESDPDGNHASLRRDFPGGWPGDSINVFAGKGLTDNQTEALNYITELLNWRKNEEVIHTGKTKQFVPENNVYVYCRYNNTDTVLIILNKNTGTYTLDMQRFKECFAGSDPATDVITGKQYLLNKRLLLEPMSPLILEINK